MWVIDPKDLENIEILEITKRTIREIVEDNFGVLATECGENGPDVGEAEWLAVRIVGKEMWLEIASSYEFGQGGLYRLASIDAGVSSADIRDYADEIGVAYDPYGEDDEGPTSSEMISKIFKRKCAEKEVTVEVDGESCAWESDWEENIVKAIIQIAVERGMLEDEDE